MEGRGSRPFEREHGRERKEASWPRRVQRRTADHFREENLLRWLKGKEKKKSLIGDRIKKRTDSKEGPRVL